MKRKSNLAVCLILAVLAVGTRVLAALPACDWSAAERLDPSIRLLHLSYDTPRLMKAQAVRIDLADRSLAFTANGRDPAWGRSMPDCTNGIIRTRRVTVPDFMADARATSEEGGRGLDMLLAVNTSPWGPWTEPFTFRYGDPRGLNISDGEIVSDNKPKGGEAIFVVWKSGLADIVESIPAEQRRDVWVAHTGFCPVLKNGKVLRKEGGGIHPRTVLGLSRDRRWMYVLTVEGRRNGVSIGADMFDLAQIMLSLGASDAVNMDGGGSTTLVSWDATTQSAVTWCQQETPPRPCALVLGIYRRAGMAANGVRQPESAVYNAANALVAPDGVRCRFVGSPATADDAFARKGFWHVENYRKLLKIEQGGERDGAIGLQIGGSDRACDTAWSATSGKIALAGKGTKYRLSFRVDTSVDIRAPDKADGAYGSALRWYGADGKQLTSSQLPYFVRKGRPAEVSVCGKIPVGAVACVVKLGFDWPNIGPDNRVTYSALSLEEIPDPPTYAQEARFESELGGGGNVAWKADVPDGCAVQFQWRGAERAEDLADQPFRGPDGSGRTYYSSPFTADAAVVQYRVTLRSDGRSTPVLREVTVGGRTDRNWTERGDVRPPRVRRISASPTRNVREPFLISVADAESVVRWGSLKISVDGADRTAEAIRNGDAITLAPPPAGWAQGLHTAEVCVADFHGNKVVSRKMFYLGDAPTTPKVTLRDDGVTLIDGKPFFPIGLYAVCKREFNGNSFDTAFKGLKEAGFNLAHTYGNSYDPGFLEAADKYGIRLWVSARFPDRKLMEIGRHNPNIIAWYLGDDTSTHIRPEEETDYDEAVKAVDPTRITVQADPIFTSNSAGSRYADYVTATDGFMPEIYPVRKEAGDATDRICVADVVRDMKRVHEDVRQHGDGKPRTCWAIIQYFKGWSGWRHFPSREQLFAMTFAAVVHGAHGMTWYTYGGFGANEGVTSSPERWRNICELAGRLSELSPVLVSRTPPQPSAPKVISGPTTDFHGNPSVTCLLKREGGFSYLFAVNATCEPVAAELTVPDAQTVEVMYEHRTSPCSCGVLTDGFAPFAVHIYRWRSPGSLACSRVGAE